MTTPKGIALVGLLLAAPLACGDEEATSVAAAADADGELIMEEASELALADDPGDQQSYTLRPKMTVSTIVLERYGSRHYTRVVLLHNDIKDASRLPIGKVIKTPDLGVILKEEPGLFRRAKTELEALLEIRRAFMALEAELEAVVASATDKMQIKVPDVMGAKLLTLSKRLEAVGEQLAAEREDTKKSPTKMIASVFEAAAIFEQLANGEMMDESFDAGQIHKRLGNAMADAMIWARVERR
jgi:hypothetical protein